MDDVVSRGILRGRPFGGVAIAVNKKYCKLSKVIAASDNFIIVMVNNCCLVNVYLPCYANNEGLWKEKYINTLIAIENELVNTNMEYLIVGGDWNCSINNNIFHSISNIISDFTNMFNINFVPFVDTNSCHTFNASSGASSNIDHFAVSENLVHRASRVNIIESGCNLSDHNPIAISIDLDMTNDDFLKHNVIQFHNINKHFRWDKSDTQFYQQLTSLELYKIQVPFQCLCKIEDADLVRSSIDAFYDEIVLALNTCADSCIVKCSKNFFKHWWSEELNLRKNDSIVTFNAWKSAGKPRSGSLFNNMNRAKMLYKQEIRFCKQSDKLTMSDDLADCLMNKNYNSFWKTFNSKVNDYSVASSIDGHCSATDIANNFANVFSAVCQPNDRAKHAQWSAKFLDNLSNYKINEINKIKCINICSLKDNVNQLQCGKAAGIDGITAEHIKYAHPYILTLLSWLFKMILVNGIVPTAFCKGIIIPLVKDNKSSKCNSSNYRGITISSCFSKIFELSVLRLFKTCLATDFTQFGFKQNSGCRNAITCLKATVKHFCSKEATVSICALDISKAFDRVCHSALLNILLSRKVDKFIICMLLNWLSNSSASVRWQGCFSHWFDIKAGVRQGGIMSPLFFNVVGDILFQNLKKLGTGCYLYGLFVSCLLYADDILLISHSCTVMQDMLNVCHLFSVDYDLQFNIKKCSFLRIGARYNKYIKDYVLGTETIKHTDSMTYLGVCFTQGRLLRFNYANAKANFYRAFNSLYQKCASSNNEVVLIHLLKTICLPILLYAVEATSDACDSLSQLDRCVFLALGKIFKTYSIENISIIRGYFGVLHVKEIIESRREKYYKCLIDNKSFKFLFQSGVLFLV